MERKSGLIIHPTSFPGKYGCGDLGEGAYSIIDWMERAGQKILQVLPLGPTGYGDSPYQAFSAFAGTPYLISFDKLIQKGFLTKNDLEDYPLYHSNRVDYGRLYQFQFKYLRIAYNRFKKNIQDTDLFQQFCDARHFWLADYALFMALKDQHDGLSWHLWDDDLKKRKNLKDVKKSLSDEVEFYQFIQWEFFSEWMQFKKYANSKNISIIGDAPIFVSYDSADVWANQHLFQLDENQLPSVVAGVPPDYFSETGQLWGNPIYNWQILRENDFEWWKIRIKHQLSILDCLRIDHFRGFEAYWEIPYGAETAINGQWIKAPGDELFRSLKKEFNQPLKDLIIAEDLGVITDEVRKLRDDFELPGMCIFEFAQFPETHQSSQNDPIDDFTEDAYLPDNFKENCVAYPGTHDNDVLHGWFYSLNGEKQKNVLNYLKINNSNDLNYAVIEKMMQSRADRVIFLIQDVLQLYSDSRMNTPGTQGVHNWSWRLDANSLNDLIAKRLYEITKKYNRSV